MLTVGCSSNTLARIVWNMRICKLIAVLAAVMELPTFGRAENSAATIRKAVERSRLNQPGTKPFHMKAELAPSQVDRGANRTGEIEIWWASPTQWKREVRSPEFHQVTIVKGDQEWQQNEGDYFPEWLREIAVALIDPVPNMDYVLEQVETGEVRKLMGMTHFSWMVMSTDGNVEKRMGCAIAIADSTELLLYGGCLGWGGEYKEYKSFHGRMVARIVSAGTPEVKAKITTLEDLRDASPIFFDTAASVGDQPLLRTVVVEEGSLRKNLLPTTPLVWPTLQDGSLEGGITTNVVVDRTGNVREIGTVLSDNPGVSEVARKAISQMRFKPYLQGGVAVQVVSRITIPFKTVRPTGAENFESARTYFERGRGTGFPAGGNGPPYLLHAEFQAMVKGGTVEKGEYADTWKSDTEWRREVRIANSRYVRARSGETRYELKEGPDAPLLKLVLKFVEPVPAIDTFVESDWRIKRDTVDGLKTVRVLSGYESPDGGLDPEHARGYWFDDSGKLVKTYYLGMETRWSQFEKFGDVEIARQINVLRNGGVAMLIHVTEIESLEDVPAGTFELPGHEWTRAFTDEVR
jgi:hypothetical protein